MKESKEQFAEEMKKKSKERKLKVQTCAYLDSMNLLKSNRKDKKSLQTSQNKTTRQLSLQCPNQRNKV
jgi:peroxiredoxin family protein